MDLHGSRLPSTRRARMAEAPRAPAYPRWLRPANKVVMALQRIGLPIGTMRVLAVPGRVSGRMIRTPVSPVTLAGRHYIIAGLASAQWAKNIRVAGHGELCHGRRVRRVRLTEVADRTERVQVLRAFPEKVPHGVRFFVAMGLIDAPTPDGFEAAADISAVFLVEADDDSPGMV